MKKNAVKIRLILEDIALISLAYILALYISFDTILDERYLAYFSQYWSNVLLIVTLKILVFSYLNMYKTIWKYASIKELSNIVFTILISNAVVLGTLLLKSVYFPRSVYLLVILLEMLLIGGLRFSYRTLDISGILGRIKRRDKGRRIMVVGGGDAGNMIIREYRNHPKLEAKPVIIIDDDSSKQGQIINGLPIVGGRKDIVDKALEYRIDEIVISIPSASKKNISQIIEICKKTGCKLKIVPGLYELIDGKINIKEIRDVQIEDVLGRDEIKVDLKEISTYISHKVILVTGGGGSIGSELCRQIASLNPRKLIILDIYENSAYEIQNELLRKYDNLKLDVIIASIRDRNRISEILDKKRPDVIFHAAAHKHVPLMEASPKEAIKNNVFGTLNLAQMADRYRVKKFVMISTDKAVSPTNIMGASKRLCEMIVQSLNVHSKTEYVSVRFGNVLGSNGSVIPLFKKQIAEGGPVTVTHKDIIRYFMTVSEAVQLVIQAGAMAKGGEIFILDMGDPVKIMDLAKDVIKLSGFEPYTDIDIKITGLRPGEKLFEELLLDEEGIMNTSHDKIFIGKPIFTDYKLLLKSLKDLNQTVNEASDEEVIQHVKGIVPTYINSEDANNQLGKEKAYI